MRGHRLRLRCFLEGTEVPIIAAQIQVQPNAPAMAMLQLPPASLGTKLFPRTLVHLFFYDFYESQSPLISWRGQRDNQAPRGLRPGVYEQSVQRRDSPPDQQPGEEEIMADYSNERYKLLFVGEVIGFSWTKNVNRRSLVLQCADLSNYWDHCYQFSNTDIFGPSMKALFSGGATNLLTDFMVTPGEVITSLLRQPSAQYPALKGLLGGIVRVLEAIGGSYYYDKKFCGQNMFFSLAELRLHITQMITAFPNDDTASKLLGASWDGLFGRMIGNLGEQVSFRAAINALMTAIFHETYAQPTPLYVPGTGGDVSGFGRQKIKSVPKFMFAYLAAENARREIDSVLDTMRAASPTTSDDKQAAYVAKTNKNNLILRLTNLRKTLTESSWLSNKKGLTQAGPPFSAASSAVAVAISKIKSGWSQGMDTEGKRFTELTKPLDTADTNLQKIVNMEVNTVETKKAEPARLNSQIFRPDIWFGPPPRCNVIFPEMYYTLNYERSFLDEPTRFLLKVNNEFFGENELMDSFYFAPRARTVKGQERSLWALYRGDVMEHELFTGVLPVFEKMGELNIFAVRSGTVKGKMPKIGLAQRSTNFLYFKHRFAARKMTITGLFMPYIAPGFPGLVIDKYVDADQVQKYREMLDAAGKNPTELRKLLGSHFLANFTQVIHNIDQKIGRTDLTCTYARDYNETTEFFGSSIEEDQTVQQRFGQDAVRTTDVAALDKPPFNAIGPAFGTIDKVEEITKKATALEDAVTLPLYTGPRRGSKTNLTTLVPTGIEVKAGTLGEDVVQIVGDPARTVVFKAWRVTEKVPRYRKDIVDLPAEEFIRPGWYGDCWHPSRVGEVYQYYFATGAITDKTQIADPDGRSTGSSDAEAVDALAESMSKAEQAPNADSPDKDAPALLTLDKDCSIESAVNFILSTYSYIKQSNLDVEEYIRAYTWRPIASMVDLFGTSDLEFSQDEPYEVLRGVEGFHSRAFGPYNDLFLLVNNDIESIVGIDRISLARERADVRGRRFYAVQDYLQALLYGTASIG